MNIQKMMKKMQADLARTQAELAERTVEASVGGGKVTVVATCAGEVRSIRIAREVVNPEDVELLEDLVLSGVKQAIESGRRTAEEEMGKLTAGLPLPPGMGF